MNTSITFITHNLTDAGRELLMRTLEQSTDEVDPRVQIVDVLDRMAQRINECAKYVGPRYEAHCGNVLDHATHCARIVHMADNRGRIAFEVYEVCNGTTVEDAERVAAALNAVEAPSADKAPPMDEARAREILSAISGLYFDEHEVDSTKGPPHIWMEKGSRVTLDGAFHLDQLEAIAWWMKHKLNTPQPAKEPEWVLAHDDDGYYLKGPNGETERVYTVKFEPLKPLSLT